MHLISISFDVLHKKWTNMFLWLFTDNIHYFCPIIVIMFVYFSFDYWQHLLKVMFICSNSIFTLIHLNLSVVIWKISIAVKVNCSDVTKITPAVFIHFINHQEKFVNKQGKIQSDKIYLKCCYNVLEIDMKNACKVLF